MNKSPASETKIKNLRGVRDKLRAVVVDPALSQEQKEKTLDGLEQDARQQSVATAEGMAAGAPSNLQDVLDAENALHQLPTDSRRR